VSYFPYDFESDENKTESKKVAIDGRVGINIWSVCKAECFRLWANANLWSL